MEASNIMAMAQATSGVAEGVGAYGQAASLRQQGKWARETSEWSARMAEIQATDAERRGEEAARKVRSQGRRIVGAQRAALAAQGVDVATGSAVDVQADTAYQSELDAQQVVGNAWREAWGLRTQAQEGVFAGRMAELDAEGKASSTMLTGALRASRGFLDAGASYSAGLKPKSKGAY